MPIPKQIFQTFKTKDISHEFQSIINSWKENNTQYKYKLYDDEDSEEFIKRHFDVRIYNAYCRIIPGAYKADLWRYCILYIYGGVYVDIDTLCIGNLDDFLQEGLDFIIPIDLNTSSDEGKHNLFNTFIASVPQSPILLNCIQRVVYHVENRIIPVSKLDFSGPGVIGRSVNTYLGLDELSSFVGKEGISKKILFLHFEQGTELVVNLEGRVLLQNKNGNPLIQKLYYYETRKAGTIDWYMAQNIIRD
jgi:hypothetical protein